MEVVVYKERLAAALDVPMRDLEAYLTGTKPLPQPLFLLALDIVANKPQQSR